MGKLAQEPDEWGPSGVDPEPGGEPGWADREVPLSPGLPALALPGQEEWPRADIDILVGAGQTAAVLFQVVPGILVEVGHLAGEVGFSETGWDTCSQRAAPGLGAGTSTEPEGSSSGVGMGTSMQRKGRFMEGESLGRNRAHRGASCPQPRLGDLASQVSKLFLSPKEPDEGQISQRERGLLLPQELMGRPALSIISPFLLQSLNCRAQQGRSEI